MTRGHPLSDDLRQVLVCMGKKLSAKVVSDYSGVPIRTVRALFREYKKNSHAFRLKPQIELRGARRMLSVNDVNFIVGQVQYHRDIYLDELREMISQRLGVHVDESTVWRALHRRGFTMKKLSKAAIERNEQRRTAFRFDFGLRCVAENAVFVDESSFDRRTSLRNRAWALRGQKAERKWFFVRGRRYSLLPALSTEGIIYARLVEGSFTMRRFRSFITGLLDRMDQTMLPGSYIIMDNARIHKDDSITTLIEGWGYHVMYLPPYSPDFNPIELAFSAIKAYVRRAGVLGRDENEDDDTYVYIHLLEAAFSVTGDSAKGWFHHCGYM